ncbi:MAG TPA: nuclear transport factor 2 family protein [Terriglobales bacterium]|jgi:ketosteroid isomerase-like protein|nr:nuclear transport factor 2 family protein [Terriglobales bacterium]
MRFLVAVSVLCLGCLAQGQGASKGASDDNAGLKAVEQKWVEAYYRGDGDTLSRLETDDFTVIANGEKPQTKAEQITLVESRGPVGVPTANLEEDIRHYGDVAIITGLSPTANVRFTAVWVKTNGDWKVAHLHYSGGD